MATVKTAVLQERASSGTAIFDTISTTGVESENGNRKGNSNSYSSGSGSGSGAPLSSSGASDSSSNNNKLTLEYILKSKDSKTALAVPLQSGNKNKMIMFPDLYLLYKDLALVNNGLKIKVYPTLSDELRAMNRSVVLRRDKNAASDIRMKMRFANRVIIAIATSGQFVVERVSVIRVFAVSDFCCFLFYVLLPAQYASFY